MTKKQKQVQRQKPQKQKQQEQQQQQQQPQKQITRRALVTRKPATTSGKSKVATAAAATTATPGSKEEVVVQQQQQQQQNNKYSTENRLNALLDAPADGSAFMSLSHKLTNEERDIEAAPKMSAKRRSRLEIAAVNDMEGNNNFDFNNNDDEDDDYASETTKTTRREKNKMKEIVDIVDQQRGGGPLEPPSSAKSKHKNKNKKEINDDVDQEEHSKSQAGMRLLKEAMRDQGYKKVLPHQDRPDYEYRLRRIATSGCVRLFNALAQAQSAGSRVVAENEKTMTSDKVETHKMAASREAFVNALRGAASSKNN